MGLKRGIKINELEIAAIQVMLTSIAIQVMQQLYFGMISRSGGSI